MHNELRNTVAHQRHVMEKMADVGAEKDKKIAEFENNSDKAKVRPLP